MTVPVPARRTPFRAGGPVTAGLAAAAVSAGPSVLLADISEFQPDIADAAYLAWSPAIVIRAAYGDAHDDKAWYGGQRRAMLHRLGARFTGIYQYLVASQDGTAQADALHFLIGTLQPGEVLIADFEEGTHAVLTAWYNRMLAHGYPHAQLWTYTGLTFGAASGALPVEWIAAYGQAEPATPHRLWQFTDRYQVPGVGLADCSVFHGTIDQLAALAFQPAAPPADLPAPGRLSQTPYRGVDLGWGAVEGASLYHYGVTDAAGHVIADATTTATSVRVPSLPAPGTYRWRVSVKEPRGLWSEWRQFTA